MTTSVSTIGPNTKTILVDNDTQAGVLSQISAILVASGLKTLPIGLGVYGDLVAVNCDGNGFSDASGTAVNHMVLGQGVALPY